MPAKKKTETQEQVQEQEQEKKPKRKTTSRTKKLAVTTPDFTQTAKQAEEATDKLWTTNKLFKKPSGDYYRLDLVIRDTERGILGNKPILTDKIRIDYKSYLIAMAKDENMSLTRYLHKLIDEDMKKNAERYEQIKNDKG